MGANVQMGANVRIWELMGVMGANEIKWKLIEANVFHLNKWDQMD
jgi:hypothetical protein